MFCIIFIYMFFHFNENEETVKIKMWKMFECSKLYSLLATANHLTIEIYFLQISYYGMHVFIAGFTKR